MAPDAAHLNVDLHRKPAQLFSHDLERLLSRGMSVRHLALHFDLLIHTQASGETMRLSAIRVVGHRLHYQPVVVFACIRAVTFILPPHYRGLPYGGTVPYTIMRRSAVFCGAGLLALGGIGAAYAVADRGDAPHSQAAAMVHGDGQVTVSRGIESVTEPTDGVFCIKVSDKSIKAEDSIPVATKVAGHHAGTLMVFRGSKECGTADDTFKVETYDPNGKNYGAAFDWVLP
jgi:hypothetical protein